MLFVDFRHSLKLPCACEYVSDALALTGYLLRIANQKDGLLKLLVPGQGLLLLRSTLRGVDARVIHVL